MPNNRAAASPKKAPCRFEELMGWQLTEDKRKVQRMRHRRSGQAPLREKDGESKWRDAVRRETRAEDLIRFAQISATADESQSLLHIAL